MLQSGAIVVGAELNGLGVARSLAQGRVPVVMADTNLSKPAMWSRHVRPALLRSIEGKRFVADLMQAARAFATPPLLILTNEFSVHAVSENREELATRLRFRLPPDATVKMLSDKAQFHAFAVANRFPAPRTAILSRLEDIELLADLRPPCVIKPGDKRQVMTGAAERAVRAADLREAAAAAARMLSLPGAIVAQEWIEGPESQIYFTLFYRGGAGETVSIFTGRKVLCFPPDVGSTGVCVAAPEAAGELEAITLAFADRAGFCGFGSMEFKWDVRARRFVMVEPTVGRTDWQEEIATLCGVNLPLAAFRHETGLAPIAPRRRAGDIAWQASFAQRPPWALMPAGTRVVNGYWRWRDPMPAWGYYALGGGPQRLWARLFGGAPRHARMAKH